MSFHRILLLALTAMCVGCGKTDPEVIASNQPPRRKATYSFGEVVSFGRGGRSDVFKAGGWSHVEPDRTWTNGRSAHLAFTLPKSKGPLALRMRLAGFVAEPFIPFQWVEVIANNERVAEWQVADVADYIAIIPPETANHEQLLIELKMPRAASPRTVTTENDPRVLGVTCFELAITEADQAAVATAQKQNAARARPDHDKAYSLGTVLTFGHGGTARRYLRSGWHRPEDEFTWTTAGPAVLQLEIPATDRPLMLRMRLTGMIDPREVPVQPTKVFANNQQIAEWQVGTTGEFSAVIPPQIASSGAPLKLALLVENAVMPKDLGIGEDDRVLGVRSDALVITAAP